MLNQRNGLCILYLENWKITKICDTVSRQKMLNQRNGLCILYLTASHSETTPRRDSFQTNRMLNQRNGLCILYLENYQDM
ncbi:hypothetical protein CEXT_682981 [Caerostris extrusa]|uniref:Uncharacterized protein n=1 Tax=Caerostris extrusa TaxID=172846 RepID=A0AAV4V8H8_CAEEX|nr:hypothetical protein CEXT_682981 [Caerostris extrusa]